ncbi:RluA family pseudouridine synthase [Ornithinibacillus sp. BX22]|uniref:Pseudouridine synthase n=2 Tax=Ornithinibacillus TaxID=484508 RepID=A0A923L8V0_9BACI|nr:MULTISPECIES: RluA family pseudouridine synthase [Ornithinibacillus]MBC5638656.1 RluA family pseudouridine synthase [Ornithinibacillus hominis]MBS3680441.1 RluA family pseudouridine synthase [Ornithinibacillus massiliensis]
MRWIIQNETEGKLLREFLQNDQDFSRRLLKSLIYDGGKILVNGEPENLRYRLKSGDIVSVEFAMEVKGPLMQAEHIPLDIMYEDDAIMVINKQTGIATIPSIIHQTGTLANGILYHYETHNIPYTVHVVTRLDRDTSGLLLIAKHRLSHSILSASQKKGKVKRKYYALVEGVLKEKKGIIDANIARKEGSIIERTVREDGQRAITHFQVVQETNSHSLLAVQLETGRTHQIRVHFSHIGHPLAGDDLYGGKKTLINRQALHCFELGFEHPGTKEWMTYQAPLPEDMKQILPDM